MLREKESVSIPIHAPTETDEFLKPAEASEVVKLTVRTLATMRSEGRGPAYTKLSPGRSGHVRYKRRDLLAWLNRNQVPA
jgi:Helix-turn-helix domain